MESPGNELIIFIVLTVLLFMGLGIALVVIVDHKARIPGGLASNPFSISGLRRDHPVISFLTALILFAIIASLLLELGVTVAERLYLIGFEQEKPELLQELHEQRFTEKTRHFHIEPASNLVDLGRKQACFYCHGDYPHSKRRMVRSLLNMHTQFIGCMTCHTDALKLPEDSYRFQWLNFSGIEVSGAPYGTSLEPDTGFLVATDDLYSKIVVYAGEGEDSRLLELTEDNPEAREFAKLASEERLSDQDREGIKRRFHALIRSKGRLCSRCHTREEKSYLPFRELGFSDQRIGDLTNLNIVGIVEKYREFYLPDLMKNGNPHPTREIAAPSGERSEPGEAQGGSVDNSGKPTGR